jgi:D-glycero-beta-D-manno-heptose 1-phosphate adenylyltransferase
MTVEKNIRKVVKSTEELGEKIKAHKILGHRIICTIGSWDVLHIGHLRYLNKAKNEGDILIVGVDSDRGIKLYKDDFRPIIPEDERMEMLSYQDCVDYITIVDDIDDNGTWQYELIKNIPIDVFVAVEDSYPPSQVEEISKHCEIKVFPRQAEKTSTTNIIQNIIKKHLLESIESLSKKDK